ncbi:MAG TPA: hypothetical protein VII93_10325, partial [Anaerolineales bacterium]
HPPVSAPRAVANEPNRLYQANVYVRRESGTSWVSPACSIDKKGPISLPLGLITPIIAAIMRITGFLVTMKTMPEAIINNAPSNKVRRRPNRSAEVVS